MMSNLYLAEKDMHSRIEDNLRAMERKNLRKKTQSDLQRRSSGFLNSTVRGWASRLGGATQNLLAWFAGPPVARRPR